MTEAQVKKVQETIEGSLDSMAKNGESVKELAAEFENLRKASRTRRAVAELAQAVPAAVTVKAPTPEPVTQRPPPEQQPTQSPERFKGESEAKIPSFADDPYFKNAWDAGNS